MELTSTMSITTRSNSIHHRVRFTTNEQKLSDFHFKLVLVVGYGRMQYCTTTPRGPRWRFPDYKAHFPRLHIGAQSNAYIIPSFLL